jgi:hypothetical protein
MTVAVSGATLSRMEAREATERAEIIHSAGEHGAFGRWAAVVVSVMAALLAIAAVSSKRGATDLIVSQERSNDAYNQLETNAIKQSIAQNDAALLRILTAGDPNQADGVARAEELERAAREEHIPNQVYFSERADELDHEAESARERYESFELAEVALQIGIVITSVAILLRSQGMLWGAVGLGVLGLLLMAEGFIKPDLLSF